MDRCGGIRSRHRFTACPNQPQVPHFGLSAPIRHYIKLKSLQEYLWALPEPILSNDDVEVAWNRAHKPPILTWNEWSKDPIKKAIIEAIFSAFGHTPSLDKDIVHALTQSNVSFIHSYSLAVEEAHC
jgi:hypothetical protein